MELITASTGEPHVSSADDGVLYASLVGTDSYVAANIGDGISCTMTNANTAAIGTGSGYINGRGFRIPAPEDVQIQSGSQLMNRNDIICVRYQKDGSGHESASLTVIQGTPTEDEAQDPTIPDGDILDGATDAYMPLWRIPIRGITAEDPEQLFSTFEALSDQQKTLELFRDSISLSTKEYQNCKVSKQGDFVIINGFIQTGNENKITIATLPSGFKPPLYVAAPTTSGGYAEVTSSGVFSIIPKPGTNYFALCYAV